MGGVNKKPKFCALCGRELLEDSSGFDRYDIYTGERLVPTQSRLYCPQFEWDSRDPRGGGNGHTEMWWKNEGIRT